MPHNETQRRAKQGVHGWRAFFLMFGCGTTAALLVVGIVVGGLRMFVSSVSSGSSGQGGDGDYSAPTWQAPSSLDVGVLDICGKTIGSIPEIKVPRPLGDNDNYVDTGENDPEMEGRVISDECVWEFNPVTSGIGSWKFTLEYKSFISEDGGKGTVELAKGFYDRKESEVNGWFSEVEDEGSGEVSGVSHYFYGKSGNGDVDQYAMIEQVRGSVYVVKMEGGENPVSKEIFWNELEPVTNHIAMTLERWVPN